MLWCHSIIVTFPFRIESHYLAALINNCNCDLKCDKKKKISSRFALLVCNSAQIGKTFCDYYLSVWLYNNNYYYFYLAIILIIVIK